MSALIRVPKEALSTLATMVAAPARLVALRDLADELGFDRCTPERLASEFSRRSGLSSPESQAVVRQVLELHAVRTKFRLRPDQLVEELDAQIRSDTSDEWKNKNLQNWEAARQPLMDILDAGGPLSLLEKRTRLSYKHQNVLYETCLITDVRPVFDDTASEIQQFAVTHVLQIDFFDGGERRSFFAAMDSKDVATLKEQCDRSATKEATIKKDLVRTNKPVVIIGEEGDDE